MPVRKRVRLGGKNVRLRPFEQEDIETYRRWINDPEIMTLIDRFRPVSRYEHERWYRQLVRRNDAVVFAIETVPGRRYVGNVWLWNIEWHHGRAEVRIVMGKRRGRGLGTEALRMIRQYAFERLKLVKLYAYVLDINVRARKAFEKAGFRVEAHLENDRNAGGKRVGTWILSTWADGRGKMVTS